MLRASTFFQSSEVGGNCFNAAETNRRNRSQINFRAAAYFESFVAGITRQRGLPSSVPALPNMTRTNWRQEMKSRLVLGRSANRFDARWWSARSAPRLLIRIDPASHDISVCESKNYVPSVALAFHFNGDGLARHLSGLGTGSSARTRDLFESALPR